MRTHRSWSVPLGRIAGIRIRIHLSFVLLIAFVVLAEGYQSGAALGWEFAWLAAVFACVLVHELCHCAAARRYGVVVKDVMLLPIGGVSEMESMPKEARQELTIAAAGPAASAGIALAAFALAYATGGRIWPPTLMAGSILARIAWLNVVLAAFNMLPALPLDGGRVLRAGLAMRMGRTRATEVAARIGRFGGIALVLVGLYYDFWLVLIGVFVFLGATAEGQIERVEAALSGVPVQAAMIQPPWTADENDLLTPMPMHQAALRQGELPIVSGSKYVGLVDEGQISGAVGGRVAGQVADRGAPTVSESDHLDAVVEALRRSGHTAVPVLDSAGSVIGIVRAADLEPQFAAATGAAGPVGPGRRPV